MTATYLDSGTRALTRPRAVVSAADSILRHRLPTLLLPTLCRWPVAVCVAPVPVPVGRGPTAALQRTEDSFSAAAPRRPAGRPGKGAPLHSVVVRHMLL